MRNYHVVLTDGSERNLTAEDIQVESNGTLWFINGTERVVAYAPGAWQLVEIERLDDKGAAAEGAKKGGKK